MKVYVVEVGAYSDRYLSAIFATRTLAEQYIYETARRAWTLYTSWDVFPERGDKTFEEWRNVASRLIGDWNQFGDVEEYDVWDALPVAE